MLKNEGINNLETIEGLCTNENNKEDEIMLSVNNVNEIENYSIHNSEVTNESINDEYKQDLFFISDVYDIPNADTTVSLYLSDDIAFLFCFYGNMYNDVNTVVDKGEFEFSDELFITVPYGRGVSILKALGYEKKTSDSVSFGAYIDDMHIRTMAELYREDWKRSN